MASVWGMCLVRSHSKTLACHDLQTGFLLVFHGENELQNELVSLLISVSQSEPLTLTSGFFRRTVNVELL